MPFPILPSNGSGSYNLTKSLRFRSSASAYLSRTPASAGNRNVWTVSFWFKRGKLSSSQSYYSAGTGGNIDSITLSSSDKISIDLNNTTVLVTSQVFRDPSAWYHLVFAVDTSQSTASNRAKLYINGSLVTAFDTDNRSSITNNLPITNTTVLHKYGYYDAGILYSDVYFAEINGIDGQQLTASSFGSTNATTGVWQPAKYAGTYGTDGYYLPFTDVATTSGSNAGLGKDFSGNGNYWTTNNISVTTGSTYDSMTDVPTLTSATTANYCVMNPLTSGSYNTISNGNLKVYGNTSTNNGNSRSTIYITTGKWYLEMTVGGTSASTYPSLGIIPSSRATTPDNGGTNQVGYPSNSVAYEQSGSKRVANSTSSYGNSYTTGDVVGVAIDADNGAIYFSKNNTWQNSGVPTSGSSKTGSAFNWTGGSIEYAFATAQYNGSDGSFNFGQQPFIYTPPTGFNALNTYNLPTSTIVQGNTVMDATLYTGNGTSQSITNAAGYKPDLVWTKSRSNANNHGLIDSVRGVSRWLGSNSTSAEDYTAGSYVTAFNSNGFSVGTGGVSNENGQTYVGWQWQAGQGTTSSNTNGSITSTVSVNASAGFSIVSYTGTGSNATVGHGLGVAPQFIIVKNRVSSGPYWYCYSQYLDSSSPANYTIYLNSTLARDPATAFWNNTAPTSSVFTVGTSSGVNGSSNAMIAYCWTPIAGFSAFGSYTGNGSTDGPFVYCGFRPKYIMVKKSSGESNWQVLDSSRSPYNLAGQDLLPNSSDVEKTIGDGFNQVDFLSNGFKIRNTNCNDNGGTYIYIGFAENPFKNALAR